MLSPEEFGRRWALEVMAKSSLPEDCKLVTATAQQLASIQLNDIARRFLAEAGLPKSCAPFLTFEEVGKGLPRIWEVYAPNQWRQEEKLPFEPCRLLGADGSDNPICVDDRDGKVVLVDHELLFHHKGKAPVHMFVNSGIPELAECLLAFHTLKPELRLTALRQIDPPAVADGAFWFYEAAPRTEASAKKTNKLWDFFTRPIKWKGRASVF